MAEQDDPQVKYYDPNRDIRVTRLWKIGKPKPIHFEIMRRAHLGEKNIDIARDLNLSPQTISNVRNSPIAIDKLETFMEASDAETLEIQKELMMRVPKALEVLDKILEADDDEVGPVLKASVAKDALDRAGFSGIKRTESKSLNVTRYLTDDDLAKIQKRALELAEGK